MSVTIRVKRGTATQWAARTTPLLSGEIGYDLTNKITKIGDGTTLWASLPSIDASSNSANTGDITFDGVQIIGAGTASGDGYGLGTLELVPDGDITSDQYLIVDPTAPNHIHIRAGGTQDASTADLFLGGERNNVHISDNGRNLSISTRPEQVINTYTNINPTSDTSFVVSNTASIYVGDTVFAPGGDTVTVDSVTQDSPEAGLITVTANLNGTPAQFVGGAAHVFIHEESYNNSWIFDSDGYLYGPGEGVLLLVEGIYNAKSNLTLQAMGINNKVILDGQNGEFLNDASIASNQIATMADIADANDYTDTAITSLGNTVDGAYVPLSDVGNPDGVASLDENGKIPLSELGNLIDGAPEALNTLNELAAAINDDGSYAATITTALGNKLDSNYVTIGNTLLEGISGQTYGLIGTSTYLDVKNTNGYNKEIELDIAAVKSQLDADGYVKQAALNAKLDTSSFTYESITIPVYNTIGELPAASSNHGRWAHVHGEGAMYYAHGGSWYKALSQDDLYISTNAQSSSYTLTTSDLGKMIEMSNGGTLTITDSSSFPVGFSADILQTGSSQVTIAGNGFTPNATPGLKLRSQWSSATVVKRGLNSWVVFGDLSA